MPTQARASLWPMSPLGSPSQAFPSHRRRPPPPPLLQSVCSTHTVESHSRHGVISYSDSLTRLRLASIASERDNGRGLLFERSVVHNFHGLALAMQQGQVLDIDPFTREIFAPETQGAILRGRHEDRPRHIPRHSPHLRGGLNCL
jgi:hypothetical protein